MKANENELFNFITVNNVHFAIITETFLKPNIKLKFDLNYVVHRYDRTQGSGGGVAIVIHRRIKHRALPHLETKVFETLGIEVQTELGISFIAAAYLPFQCTREHKNYFKGDSQKHQKSFNFFF